MHNYIYTYLIYLASYVFFPGYSTDILINYIFNAPYMIFYKTPYLVVADGFPDGSQAPGLAARAVKVQTRVGDPQRQGLRLPSTCRLPSGNPSATTR